MEVGMSRKFGTEGGFTLIELMVTVNIVGILSVIAMHYGISYLDRAREKITKENLRAIRHMIELYNLDTGQYPAKLVKGPYYNDKAGDRGGGTEIFSEGYKYLKRIPNNQMPGADDNYPPCWVTQFFDADSATYEAAFAQQWDGWFYYYQINGEVVGKLVVPRSGCDIEGNPYSEW